MQIINFPWRKQFEVFVASARKELRIAVPYYSEDIIRMILKRSKATDKYFLLKLSEREVLAGAQSPKAARLLQEHDCTVKFIEKLHAKTFIADRSQAIVTSSNLTNPGLSNNVEVGVLIDEPKAVQAVLSTFEKWYDKADSIDDAELSRLESLQKELRPQTPRGKSYGNFVQEDTASSGLLSRSANELGWILIHSPKKEEDGSPQDEIEGWNGNVAGKKWYWTRPMVSRPGPFRLLLCWQGVIFGEFLASKVTPIRKKGYKCAFVLEAYHPRRKVLLTKLHGPKHYRDLIKLTKRILTDYEKAASAGKNS